MKPNNNATKRIVWIAVVVLVAAFAYGIGPGHWFRGGRVGEIAGAPARRGALRISVLQRGNLANKDTISIKSEIEGQTTIISLIEEGKFVQPGDPLVELDASDLVEKKVQQEIAFQNADAAYTKAKAAFEIQESQNKSDIELAERKLKFAEIDKAKYLEGDWLQLSSQAEDKILLGRQELAQAQNTYTWSKSLAEKGFLTKTELDRDELEFNRAEVQLKQSERAKELLAQYDDPRRKTELDANLREAERGLERTKLQAHSRIADYEAALRTSESRLKLETEKLAKYVDQLSKTHIVSPVAGMVVYTRGDGGRYGMGDLMQEGTQVRERQEILTIPRNGAMIAEASVHESVLQQVSVGLPCTLNVDALPGQEFRGKVGFVALLPDKASWWANPNQRLYRTEITIENPSAEMRPGMSCSIEILAEEIPDALYVPLQSVLMNKGRTIAFVVGDAGAEERPVKVGKNNDKWVQILEGLAENEVVLLSPPAGFTLEQPEGKNGASTRKGPPGADAGVAPAAGAQPAAAASSSPGAPDSSATDADRAKMRERFRGADASGKPAKGPRDGAPGRDPAKAPGSRGEQPSSAQDAHGKPSGASGAGAQGAETQGAATDRATTDRAATEGTAIERAATKGAATAGSAAEGTATQGASAQDAVAPRALETGAHATRDDARTTAGQNASGGGQ